jgi:hypothetical protein
MSRRSGKGRRPPKLRRRYYGQGKPGQGYLPVIPPKPPGDLVWDDHYYEWLPPKPEKQGDKKGDWIWDAGEQLWIFKENV